MDPLSLGKIPGISIHEVKSHPDREDRQFEITVDKNYDFKQEEITLQQTPKNISFKDRFKLGRLLGCNFLGAIGSAIFTSFRSQKEITEYYVEKIKKMREGEFFEKLVEFNKKKKETDLEEKKIFFAFFVKVPSNTETDLLTGLSGLAKKAFADFSVEFDLEQNQIKFKRDRNILQTIAGIRIRGNPYEKFKQSNNIPKSIISEKLLEVAEDPFLKEVQKTQSTFLDILGFQQAKKNDDEPIL